MPRLSRTERRQPKRLMSFSSHTSSKILKRGFAADNYLPGGAAAAHAEFHPNSTATATPMAVLDRFRKLPAPQGTDRPASIVECRDAYRAQCDRSPRPCHLESTSNHEIRKRRLRAAHMKTHDAIAARNNVFAS